MEKENNVSRILLDSITDNNLADDLIFESIDLFNYVFKNNLYTHSMVQSGFILKKQKSCRV